ncbi:hypothetical protein KIN20_003354 [Parelaphostrongylus tenuis]|uniref:Uncharacterized protein n=1 Tax=Parelaphostrongylus tenuis TaxID=148309 RepID=A0AAD5M182_PARTN|nr:hypothetical protein KIN20_003354 [Parelaphostrongylus tenuis]
MINCSKLLLLMAITSIHANAWIFSVGSRGAIPVNHEVLLRIGSDFDYLMLTRIHAPAVCRADDDTVPDSCEIPDGSSDWSIHGLWPNYKNGSYPQFCDGVPKKFDDKLIKPIERRLFYQVIVRSPDISEEYAFHNSSSCAAIIKQYRVLSSSQPLAGVRLIGSLVNYAKSNASLERLGQSAFVKKAEMDNLC